MMETRIVGERVGDSVKVGVCDCVKEGVGMGVGFCVGVGVEDGVTIVEDGVEDGTLLKPIGTYSSLIPLGFNSVITPW